VTFDDAAKTNTTATFSVPGSYTLMLNADDGLHAVARDAVVITVTRSIVLNIAQNGTTATVTWVGGTAPFALEETVGLFPPQWNTLLTTNSQTVVIPVSGSTGFYRVRGQ
jgi:hypothetical protein